MGYSGIDIYKLNQKMRKQIMSFNKSNYYYTKDNLRTYNLDTSVRKELDFLEMLDPYTRTHSENVAAVTVSLCEYLNKSKVFTLACTICAYLHDIGKTGIPAKILQKNEALTEEEFEIIKKHTTIGYDICIKDPVLKPYANGVKYHHENLDGTGYPDGLAGDKIPIEAQIIKVADEYDALVSKRQYKSHVDISETISILAEKVRTNKMNKKVIVALVQVINDDILIEIDQLHKYVKILKDELKPLEPTEKILKGEYTTSFFRTEKYYEKKRSKISTDEKEILDYISNVETLRAVLDTRVKLIDKLNAELTTINKIKI